MPFYASQFLFFCLFLLVFVLCVSLSSNIFTQSKNIKYGKKELFLLNIILRSKNIHIICRIIKNGDQYNRIYNFFVVVQSLFFSFAFFLLSLMIMIFVFLLLFCLNFMPIFLYVCKRK